MALQLAEIVTELIQPVGVLGDREADEDRLVNLFGSPAADGDPTMEEMIKLPYDPRLMDFGTGIANRS